MAAGVHHAIHLGAADTGTSQVLLGLLDRQRIAVGTQQDSLTLAGSLAFQNGYNTAMGHYFILNAHTSQFLTNAFNGLVLPQGQLGILMEIPAHLHYIGIHFFCKLINFHLRNTSVFFLHLSIRAEPDLTKELPGSTGKLLCFSFARVQFVRASRQPDYLVPL